MQGYLRRATYAGPPTQSYPRRATYAGLPTQGSTYAGLPMQGYLHRATYAGPPAQDHGRQGRTFYFSPALSTANYLKAVGLEIFGPVFAGFGRNRPPGPPWIAGARPAHQFARNISPANQF